MSTFRVDERTSDYIVRSCTPPDAVVSGLIRRTAELGELYEMMTPAEEAGFLKLLAASMSARTVIDVGTFTGLSALSLARGLAPGGRVITCDVTEQWLDIAREYWELAGVADRVEFRLGPARKTLAELAGGEQADIVFIDADKMFYPAYCEAAAPLLRSGGLLVLDNVLLHGTVVDPGEVQDETQRYAAEVMDRVNATLARDERFETVMLPVADGMSIARRK